ncbi:MAG: DNA repair protein RadC [Lachnospiraceae bacterium]|jgi:DNA repair protein RadC|nr:DNA repair protein RadC [Lachnospiraceae bacterium]
MKNNYKEPGPYEKFLHHGPASLTKAELLAIILRTGTKKQTAVELGEQILRLCADADGGLNGLHHVTLEELMGINGIGQIKAVKIRCLTEFALRMAKESAASRLSFESPQSVADYYMESLRHIERETVMLLMLDNRLHLIAERVLSIGTVNCSLLSPREVFIDAVRVKAVYLMLLHNHPSGDCRPSVMDEKITKRIAEAGKLLGIELMDHIIIGDINYYSFKEHGII